MDTKQNELHILREDIISLPIFKMKIASLDIYKLLFYRDEIYLAYKFDW